MATLSPNDWKRFDPRQHPESVKRLASGFWRRDYSVESQTETWTCDKRKLNDMMAQTLIDPKWSRLLTDLGPSEYLDRRFGKGTAKAFHTQSNGERLQMRFNDEEYMDRYMGFDPARGKDMSYATWNNTGTTTTTATSGSATTSDYWITDAVKSELKKAVKKQVNTKKPMRPFTVEHGGDLISSLQRHFDLWAKPQMRLLHG